MILKLVLFNQALVYVQSYAAGLDKKPANIKSREATKIKSDCNYLSDWQVLKKKKTLGNCIGNQEVYTLIRKC